MAFVPTLVTALGRSMIKFRFAYDLLLLLEFFPLLSEISLVIFELLNALVVSAMTSLGA